MRKERESNSSLRLTSFIDVIFILLLFFLVTSLIMKQAGGRQGEKAYLRIQNAFSDVGQVRAYLTVFVYKSGSHVKYRILHKGEKISADNYLQILRVESAKKDPNSNVIIHTTAKMLMDPNHTLSRQMDRLSSQNINQVLGYYKKILTDNELTCAIVAQPDVPFFDVIKLYSFMKSSADEGGLGATQVVLLEYNGDLTSFLTEKIRL
ncbi:hypothetical protein JXA02_01145 [candidate division KSB1 bacterium]|nr:hypothetical protein [candidate division KSB1 bacterium]RQW11057.1 MAG: hypothetical protein EH222_01220 [candidate division KSB1 bacterium]